VRIDTDKIKVTLSRLSTYAGECNWPEQFAGEGVYYAQNPGFSYSSGILLHTMIRAFNSRRVIEIGSGYSTLASLDALRLNYPDNGFKLTCIEPYPHRWLEDTVARHPNAVELLKRKAEEVDLQTYLMLEEGDIFFIDSSHISKLNSDVNYLYLRVLPRLKPGVIIHIHDIYIPYEYPRVHFYGKPRYYWNEQYFVQAFLTGNKDFEVILPGYYAQTDMQADFCTAFPGFDPAKYRRTSSFWLRKVD
jgi:predicted O-methyltransferase YrrM